MDSAKDYTQELLNQGKLVSKTVKVISSCRTVNQIKVAKGYLKLAIKKLNSSSFKAIAKSNENILLNHYWNRLQILNQRENTPYEKPL